MLIKKYPCQYEDLHACQYYAECYRKCESKYKALSLSKANDFLKNDLKTTCSGLAGFVRNLVYYLTMNVIRIAFS